MFKKKWVSSVVFLCVTFFVNAQSYTIDSILGKNLANQLRKNKIVERISYKESNPKCIYCPNTVLAKESVRKSSVKDPVLITESLFLVEKNKDSENDMEKVSQIIRRLSTLQGVQYYSNTKKKMRVLYEKSYVVKSSADRTRIADPVAGSANNKVLVAVQKDSTFGEYAYQYSYRQLENEVSFTSKNLDKISYLFVNLMDPGDMHVSFVVIDCGDCYVLYASIKADFAGVPGMESTLNKSFSARSKALYDWFVAQYSK